MVVHNLVTSQRFNFPIWPLSAIRIQIHKLILFTDDSDVQAQSSVDSTLVAKATTDSTEDSTQDTCSVGPSGS